MAIAPALPLIAAGLAAAGAAVSAVGAIRQGKAEANAAEYEADVIAQQAEQERLASERDADDFRKQQSRLFAQRRAIMGASGVAANEGSPLLASEDFAAEAEYGAQRIEQGGELRATRLDQQGSLLDSQAKSARTGGFVRGGSLLLQGAGSAASAWGRASYGN